MQHIPRVKTIDNLLEPAPTNHNNITFSPKSDKFAEYFED